MKIYLDYIFIENFLITILTLLEAKKILRINCKTKRIIFASIVSALYVTIMILLKLNFMNYLLCKVILVQIIIFIAFKPQSIKEIITYSIKFFLINVFNIGIIYVVFNFLGFEIKNTAHKLFVYLLAFVIGSYTILYFIKVLKNRTNTEIYDVEIEILGEKIKYKGFLDTGNTAFCYTYNLPVIFAEYVNNLEKKLNSLTKIDICINTLNGRTEKKGYLIDNVSIKEKNITKKVIVVFVRKEEISSTKYNMILNNKMF